MLVIGRVQLGRILEDHERRFAEKTAQLFRAKTGSLLDDLTDDALLRRISEICRGLRDVPLNGPIVYAQVVVLALLAGPGFETDPTIRAALRADGIPDEQKVRILSGGISVQPGTKSPRCPSC